MRVRPPRVPVARARARAEAASRAGGAAVADSPKARRRRAEVAVPEVERDPPCAIHCAAAHGRGMRRYPDPSSHECTACSGSPGAPAGREKLKALVLDPGLVAAGHRRRIRRTSASAGPPLPLAVCEVRDLAPPAPGWVLVRPSLSGICATDLDLLFRREQPSILSAYEARRTVVPGHEVVGVVERAAGTAWVRAPATAAPFWPKASSWRRLKSRCRAPAKRCASTRSASAAKKTFPRCWASFASDSRTAGCASCARGSVAWRRPRCARPRWSRR